MKYLKIAQQKEARNKLSPEAAVEAASDYSRWLYDELGNELFAALPPWRQTLGLLTRVGTPFRLAAYEAEVPSEPEVLAFGMERTLRVLFDYGVLGMVHSSQKAQFKYTNPQLTFDPKALFAVHTGLRKHLQVSARGSRPVNEPAEPDLRYR